MRDELTQEEINKRMDDLHREKLKERRKIIYRAYRAGTKAPFGLRTLIESNISLKVLRAVYDSKFESI